MTSTALAVVEQGSYLALAKPLDEIKEILADTIGDQELGEFDLPRVKIPSGGTTTWEIPGPAGVEPTRELSGILVSWKRTRGYWENPEPTGEPPTCRSEDGRVGIGAPGGPCKTCPLSQFGTDLKGGPGQACKEKEIWFLLRPGSFLPLVLALPATSLKAAQQYRVGIGSAGITLATVVTTITLRAEQGPEGPYGIAVPALTAQLSKEDAEHARAYARELKPLFEQAAKAMTEEAVDGTVAADDDPFVPEQPAATANPATTVSNGGAATGVQQPPVQNSAPPVTGYEHSEPVAAQAAAAAAAPVQSDIPTE